MSGMSGWAKGLIVAGAALSVAACASYPTEPRYSTRADTPHAVANVPASPNPYPNAPVYPGQPGQPYPGAVVTNEAPPPARAPIESIDGGGLPPAATTSSLNGGPAISGRPATSSPNYPSSSQPEPAYSPPSYNPPGTPRAPAVAGAAAYVIQPGDTISGVGRRFQTPVQTLIDLNGLGPRGSITSGQNIVLPENAVDTGRDPYATGPAPVGVTVPHSGAVPPPPTPPAGNAALPPARSPVIPAPVAPATGPIRPPAQTTTPSAPVAGSIGLQWPVRGDIVRRFGPVGMGERNNGVNIGASAGAPVVASASGRVAYVGDALAGQGLTVLIVHRDGWRTVYGHLGSATVEDGADVRAGQQIGTVGLTAGDGRPSMHFETRHMQGDEPVAIDPLTVLPR
ncbi:peptidoglycan DD-metalloendopeptidase family protein [Brevundimonas goettingensis]|nr:peptidoglycan DD-metalloendopeptidase family protein [Brevundimonas goettingensis]